MVFTVRHLWPAWLPMNIQVELTSLFGKKRLALLFTYTWRSEDFLIRPPTNPEYLKIFSCMCWVYSTYYRNFN